MVDVTVLIDKTTIFLVFMLVQALGAVLYWLTVRRHPHLPGPGWWGLGSLAAMAGFAGILLNGTIPDVLAINLANSLVFCATFFLWFGLRAFYAKPLHMPLLVFIVSLASLLHILFTFVWPSVAARIWVVSFFNCLGSALALRELLLQKSPSMAIEVNLLRVFLGIDVLLHFLRMLGAIVLPPPSSYAAPNPLEGFFLLAFVISAVGRLMLFITLISGRLQDERVAAEERARSLAYYDALTGLPNRRLFMDRLQQMLADRRREKSGALLFIDMDNFKTLNDTLGHDYGDALLVEVALRLKKSVRVGDTVARLGGDEFVVLLKNLGYTGPDAANRAEVIAEKILAELNLSYHLKDREYLSTPSIGVALIGAYGEGLESLLKRADMAMYQAKGAGRNTIRFFDPEMQAAVMARTALVDDLRLGISNNQLRLLFQPQVNSEGLVVGAEALVRWEFAERGTISPGEFIPLAEETGLILPLGQWVLEAACRQLDIWGQDARFAHLTLAVNISARQFKQPSFVDHALAVITSNNVAPSRLQLELTESLLADDVEEMIAKMEQLRVRGVGFALDDFGTGYSSLAYLKRLPLDQLKIDQSFVRDLLTDANDASIAGTIIVLANNLKLSVIAEGVETQEQRDFLAKLGCYNYQGYFFEKPLPIHAFQTFALNCAATPGRFAVPIAIGTTNP